MIFKPNKDYILKQKTFKSGDKIIVYKATSQLINILYLNKESEIVKSKSYILGTSKSIQSKVFRVVNKEFNLWKKLFWKNNFLSEDDSDIINFQKKNIQLTLSCQTYQ